MFQLFYLMLYNLLGAFMGCLILTMACVLWFFTQADHGIQLIHRLIQHTYCFIESYSPISASIWHDSNNIVNALLVNLGLAISRQTHSVLELFITLLFQDSYLWLKWSSLGFLLMTTTSIDGAMLRLIRRWSGGRERLVFNSQCKKLAVFTTCLASLSCFIPFINTQVLAMVVISLYSIAAIAIRCYYRTLKKYY